MVRSIGRWLCWVLVVAACGVAVTGGQTAEAAPVAVEEVVAEGAEGASVAEPGAKEEKPEKEAKKKE